MSLELKKKINCRKPWRQNTLSRNHCNSFTPKRYPSIFSDQRLRSRLNGYWTHGADDAQ